MILYYFEVEIFHIAIFIKIHFEAFEAFEAFAHLVILFDFRYNWFVSFGKGENEIMVRMQTCKLAKLQSCKVANASNAAKSSAKERKSGVAIFLLLFCFYPVDDSANLLLTIFDYKLTTLFISGTHFCEEPN